MSKQVSEQVTSQDTEQKSRQISGQMSGQITHEKSVADIERSILTFCKKPKSRKEIHEYISQFSKSNIIKSYINPLLKKGKLIMTIPDKPHSKNQKYITKSVRKKWLNNVTSTFNEKKLGIDIGAHRREIFILGE